MHKQDLNSVNDLIQNEAFKSWVLHSTPELDSQWNSWLLQNPEKSEMVDRGKEMLLRLDFTEHQASEERKEKIYQNILSSIKNDAVAAQTPQHKIIKWIPTYLKAVAASVILILAVWFAASIIENDTNEGSLTETDNIDWIEKKVELGQKLNLTLSDGTKVKLNSGSVFRFPSTFKGNIRQVALEGEAYFDVHKDSLRSFIVKTGDVDTKVLGTRFNIRESNASNTVEVTVEEGKVAVSSKNAEQRAVLRPNEQATYSSTDKKVKKNIVDASEIIAWKDGTIIFNKASLNEMVEVLNKWYGYDFQVVGKSKIERKFSGEFNHKSIDNVLSHLAYSSAFDYKLDHKTKKVIIIPH